jgi:hypothetical protein
VWSSVGHVGENKMPYPQCAVVSGESRREHGKRLRIESMEESFISMGVAGQDASTNRSLPTTGHQDRRDTSSTPRLECVTKEGSSGTAHMY